MAEEEQAPELQPIIIIKRNRGGHEEHHGGVWKIAFADFMTAMMAFFLVMWLINASNDETRSQVASYFNPVKLTDAVAGPKGVRSSEPFVEVEEHDEKNSEGGGGARKKAGGGSEGEEADSKAEKTSEQALFQDPYAVLVEIAGEKTTGAGPASSKDVSGQGSGLAGGDAFRDPFDPAFWLQSDNGTETPGDTDQPDGSGDTAKTAVVTESTVVLMENPEPQSHPKKSGTVPPTKMVAVPKNLRMPAGTNVMTPALTGDKTPVTADKQMLSETADKMPAEPLRMISSEKTSDSKQVDPAAKVPPDSSGSMQAAAKLKAEIMAAAGVGGQNGQPNLIVNETEDGLVVSLTDDLDFGMFASASARPNSEMVRFMDRIAGVLAKRTGRLIVRGHTDSRPFRSDNYDNWRLSTARAHMAFHMLVRGGVDAERFSRIEGHADRDPRNKSDTEAAENRRIEILLVRQGS